MDSCKHLIIGAGPAALAAAQAIRTCDKAAGITLVTREETLPYSPAVLPYLLNEELTEKELFAKGRDLLAALKINLICCKEVAAVLHETKEVKFTSGQCQAYDKLLIATGAAPQIPAIENLEPDQIYTFRTFSDFEKLHRTLTDKQTVAIYGAGLVAVEAAEKLCMAGHRVTIIARSSLLRKYFSPKNVAVLEQAFSRHGGRIRTNNTLASVRKVEDKLELMLSNNEKLVVDRLLVATGVTPNLIDNDLIPVIEGGLKVGRHMETNLPDIYAAGDVAAAPSFYDGRNAPCPILPEAVLQGKIAGANMAGKVVEYSGWIPGNYLRCFDESLFSVGLTGIQSGSRYKTLEKQAGGSSLKLIFTDDCLVGVEALNMKLIHPGVFLNLIRKKIPVTEYQELLLAKPRETACWLMLKQGKTQAV
ncbi:NAD(P)/FAD-dependent oxidoreductase [Sporomusa sp.]|uniref:NAD(P)/FAD-dependent oxidoreductase n=1 Tax=Sporomusa sp. TaxID=2078658 RepID=UPI002C2B7D87|nr:FAD-dependent oxidoreductase [Sporomusa sp.]HWR09465.1 FAD-dependent oxidoreductase [Sporomusa sp.]